MNMVSLLLCVIFFVIWPCSVYALCPSPMHQAWHDLPDAMHIVTNKGNHGACYYETIPGLDDKIHTAHS